MLRPVLPALAAVALCLCFATPLLAQDAATAATTAAAPPPVTADDAKKAADGAKQAGNIAWILTATALVMFMMPGLALFYGGMVRRKNVLGTMMHTMVALGIVGVQWAIFGYALAFGDTKGGYIGWNWELFVLSPNVAGKTFPGIDIPVYLHAMFQGMFAIITVALVSGAFAERVKFGAYCLFVLLWTTLVYDPLAHWVWSINWTPDDKGAFTAAGWLGAMGAIDFAGGTVVHIAAGFGGLAATLFLRKRIGYPQHSFHPNGMVLTLLGAGMLWFGWFGFNAGSALGSSVQAVSALTVTQIAAAAAGLAWVFAEWAVKGKPTGLGFASGIVAGLVAITPASGFVAPDGALVIGVAAGMLCYGAVLAKSKLGYDDTLDAFGVHGIGGLIGAILTGFLVSIPLWMAGTGLKEDAFVGKVTDGKWDMAAQVKVQVIASVVSALFSFVVTAVIVLAIDKTIGFTLSAEDENAGLDLAAHGEVGFDYGGAGLAEEVIDGDLPAPKAASAPPNGKAADGSPKRFTVIVDGPDAKDLAKAWTALCQPGDEPPSPEFRAVYPYVTTVSGNRFRFRGGNTQTMRENLEKLLRNALDGAPVKTHVEN